MTLHRRLAACVRPASIALFVACAPSGDRDDRADETGAPEADGDTGAEADTGTDSGTDTGTDSGTDTAPPGPAPSGGDLTAAATVAVPQFSRAVGALDLDGDDLDEVLVYDWQAERLHIGRVDARAGTAVLEAGPVFTGMSGMFSVGNAQVVIQRTSGDSALATLSREADGTWSATTTELPYRVMGGGPVGDLDGDSVGDVMLQLVRSAYVVRGPVDPDLPGSARILDIADYDDGHGGGFASADLDADGADDLLTYADEDGTLEIVYGPIPVGTVARLADLADTVIPVEGSSFGVVEDLDGDGTREVVVAAGDVLVYDGLVRGTTAAEPERVIESLEAELVAPGLAPVLSVVGAEVGWWYALPTSADYRPDAAVPVYTVDHVVYGRFGSADVIDVAWTGAGFLNVVLGFEAPPGDDLDRDGWGAAADCDDADPALRPEAPDHVDGVDQDCDGTVDEAAATPLVPVLAWEGTGRHHALGWEVAAWGPSHAVARSVPGVEEALVVDLIDGGLTPVDLLDDVSGYLTPYAAGDLDGDGHADIALHGSSGTAGVYYGPVGAAEGVSFAAGIDSHAAAAGVGDLDGDGYDELVATGAWVSSTGEWSWRAVLAAGQAARDGAFDLTLLDDSVRTHIAVGPVDLDGDGHDDLVLQGSGGAPFWLGPLAPDLVPGEDNASGTFTGFGDATLHLGDVDGDHAADLLLAFSDEDRVGVSFGPWSAGTWDLTTPDLTYTGPTGSGFGAAVASEAGEWLFVGAPDADRAAGAAFGFPLDTPTSADSDHAAWRVDGVEPGAALGTSLHLGDFDVDGALDLLVGAPFETAPLDDEGTLRRYELPASP